MEVMMIVYLTGDFQHTYITYLFLKWLRQHKENEKVLLLSPNLNNENDTIIGKLSAYASSFMVGKFNVSRKVLDRIDRLVEIRRDIDDGFKINGIKLEEEVIFLGLNVIEGGFWKKLKRDPYKGPRFIYADRYLQLWNDEEEYIGDLWEIEMTPDELGYLLGIRFEEADEYDKKRKGMPEKFLAEKWFDGVEIMNSFDGEIDIERARYYYPRTGIVMFRAAYKIIFEEGWPIFKIFIPYNEKDKHRNWVWSELLIFISAVKFLIPFSRFSIVVDRRNEGVEGSLDDFKYHLNIQWEYYYNE
jgi:hypothetical protein